MCQLDLDPDHTCSGLLELTPAAPAHKLTFSQAIPRHLVHRAAVAEVFLTDAIRTAEDHYRLAAQWPRDHALYSPSPAGLSDPLLFAETIRQSLVYLAHRYYDIPLSHRFIGSEIDFEITDPSALRVGAAPLPLVMEARWEWVDNRPPRRYGMRVSVVLTAAGRECARGSLRVIAVDERLYTLLRFAHRDGQSAFGPADPPRGAPKPVPAAAVGRLREKDVVLAPGVPDRGWRMRFSLDHAILFDHPSDHLPLMVALEGFRQLGHLLIHEGADASRPALEHGLVSMSTECLAFGELDEPIDLIVREQRRSIAAQPARLVRIDAMQGDLQIAASAAVWKIPRADPITARSSTSPARATPHRGRMPAVPGPAHSPAC